MRQYHLLGAALLAVFGLMQVAHAQTPTQAPRPELLLSSGWNLVTLPPGSDSSAIPGPLYAMRPDGSGYDAIQPANPTIAGAGYWVYSTQGLAVGLGSGSDTYSVDVPAGGWALVGDPSGTQTAAVTGADFVYAYNPLYADIGNGHYYPTPVLSPGTGALAYSAAGGTLTVMTDLGSEQVTDPALFGPQQIWSPDGDAIRQLNMCIPRFGDRSAQFACVRLVMQANGATPDAIAFFHLTGWFLKDLQDTGTIELGTILNPWRANENVQSALLGGNPPVVLPEQEGGRLPVTADPAYLALQATYPNLMFWAPDPTLEQMVTSPSGGQRFIFDYRLLDGCHACTVVGQARIALDFSPDGTYDGPTLLGVTPRAADPPEAGIGKRNV